MGLSSQSFTSWCPTQSYKRCTNWRINLFHFLAFQFQAMYGLLVFYMIFQAVMILKGSYNVVSMKWELRNCFAFDCSSTHHRLFFLGIFMYGSGFLLWNLGELKISQSSAKLDPQRTRSALTWKECEVTCPRSWLRWPNFMDGGTCLRVGLSCLPPGPIYLVLCVWLNRSHYFPFQPHHSAIAGYATYMNIQFCLFHRLSYLKLSPRYTSDLMGVAVQVWRIEVKRWSSVILAGDQVCICVAHSSPYLWFSSCFISWNGWQFWCLFGWQLYGSYAKSTFWRQQFNVFAIIVWIHHVYLQTRTL